MVWAIGKDDFILHIINLQRIDAADAKPHHIAWDSSDISIRGACLFHFVIANDLETINGCIKPRFVIIR